MSQSDFNGDIGYSENSEINSLMSSKLKLPKFKENDNCEAWVNKCDFLLGLNGLTDESAKIGQMCSQLPDPIQETVILELAQLDKAKISIKDFLVIFNRACRKNPFVYENLLDKLKYDPEEHLNLRNFYYRVNQLVKQTIGDECDSMVEKITMKEFLKKLPKKIQNSEFLLEYRKEKSDNMDIVDKCAELYEKQGEREKEVNALGDETDQSSDEISSNESDIPEDYHSTYSSQDEYDDEEITKTKTKRMIRMNSQM
ncbi:Oidioi.mRNA.OKI2018_I69.chr2.g3970.t1.cds [Oikopleura dioica]|uniref:Oidioi.mRNA.OKI2018_I69.chr2.g3970.t1.cds n=1 Tax=Oikopleura dioica TaxID=34765 RepID=A0ABN7T4Z3_OIKDI|nr:Oidioi.mRNA.OKI2018_I69.chr2.g3970.t1.cds [Oikopleura dioica]